MNDLTQTAFEQILDLAIHDELLERPLQDETKHELEIEFAGGFEE